MSIKVNQIKETCLYVEDLERCYAFYHGLLGFPCIGKVEGRHVFFRAGSSVLLCFISSVTKNDERLPPHHGKGALHLAFEVDTAEYDIARKKLMASGIKITHEEDWKPGIRSFYFEDPDGHVLEIVPPGMWD